MSGQGLGLDPENDPIIATTDWGLDIKFHQAISVDYLGEGVKFAGYPYITAGGVNWVIIGQSDKGLITEYDSTPAGVAIKNDENRFERTVIKDSGLWCEVFKDIVATDELEFGEVLCFAQGIVQSGVQYNTSTGKGNNYSGSNLQSVINKWYDDNLKSLMDSCIVSKTLNATYSGGTSSVSAKLFPLAGTDSNESFYVLDYLISGSDEMQAPNIYWWLRSGDPTHSSYAYRVNDFGIIARNHGQVYVTNTIGVRPAFVLKI